MTRALEERVSFFEEFGDGRSPSGKAPGFGSGIEGSNPSRPASFSKDGRDAGVALTLRLFYFNGFTIYHEPTSRRA